MKAVCEDDDKKRRFFADSVSAPAVEKSDLSPPNRRWIPPLRPLLDFHDGPTFGHGILPRLQPKHD